MPEPVVSVIIPCHNSAATVERALGSALAQTLSEMEIILVDDASTDNTVAIVRSRFSDPRLRLIALSRNVGPASARNRGIDAARGTYVAFLDSDDEWLPEKIGLQVEAMKVSKNAALCGCDAVWDYPDGSIELTAETEPPTLGAEAWQALLGTAFVHTSYVMAPRELVRRLGGFDQSLLVGEDQDLWIRLALAGDVVWVNKPLVRVHNLSGGFMRRHAEREADFLLPMLQRHILAQRQRLGASKERSLLGRRYAQIGRNLYVAGVHWRGAKLILRAAALGHDPLWHLLFLVHASAPGRFLKQRLRPSRALPTH